MEKMRRGFTLVEMLVVVGIIAILIVASFGSYNSFVKNASRQKCTELMHQVKTAMVAMYNMDSSWPRAILGAPGAPSDGEMTPEVGAAFAARGVLSLTAVMHERDDGTKVFELTGNDRCGIVTPWATDVLKRSASASDSTDVPTGGKVSDHRLHFAIDEDGDGIVEATVGGKSVRIRGTAVVWCGGADGKIVPYPYAKGGKQKTDRNDDVYSWSPEQVEGK